MKLVSLLSILTFAVVHLNAAVILIDFQPSDVVAPQQSGASAFAVAGNATVGPNQVESRNFDFGGSSIAVELSAPTGLTLSGKLRNAPTSSGGEFTYGDLYRDLVEVAGTGNLTLKVSGLVPNSTYSIKLYAADTQFANNTVWTFTNTTPDPDVVLGSVTNSTAFSFTGNDDKAVAASVTTDALGEFTLTQSASSARARISGLMIDGAVVPEPSVYAALAAGLLCGIALLRRSRSSK